MLGYYSKPSLLLYGDYLYCFNQLNEKNTFFEKTYLGYNTRKIWEKVYPLFKGVDPKEFIIMILQFLELLKNILFIGRKKANKKSFRFNPLNNTIMKTDGNNEQMVFKDKTFYKLNKLTSIAIPSNFEQKQELALLDKYNYSLKKIKYKIGQQKSNNDLTVSIESIHDLYVDKDQKGNISLQGKFLSSNQKNFFFRTLGKPIVSQINTWLLNQQPKKYIQYNYPQNNIVNRYYLNNANQGKILFANNQQNNYCNILKSKYGNSKIVQANYVNSQNIPISCANSRIVQANC